MTGPPPNTPPPTAPPPNVQVGPVESFLTSWQRRPRRLRWTASALTLLLAIVAAVVVIYRHWDETTRLEPERARTARTGEWFESQAGGPIGKPVSGRMRVVALQVYDRLTPVRSLDRGLALPGTDYAVVVLECHCSDRADMRAPTISVVDPLWRRWAGDGSLDARELGGAARSFEVNSGELAGVSGATRFAVVVPVPEGVRDLRVLVNDRLDPVVVTG